MSNAKAQHELVGVLLDRYPELVYGIGELVGIEFPEHDKAVPAPNNHQVRNRSPIETDGTVRLLREGRPAYFTQVEMQRSYSWGKLTTLRAYHGSEVRNSRCGGHLVVLSPKPSVTRRFRENDALFREALAYRSVFLSGEDLSPLRGSGRKFSERALAAGLIDFENDIPASAVQMIKEMQDQDEPLLADMLVNAMLEECADPVKVEEALASELAMERLASLPSFQKLAEKARIAEREKAAAEAERARAEAAAEQARTRAEAAAERDRTRAEAAAEQARTRAEAAAERERVMAELAKSREETREARLSATADALVGYFYAKGDALSPDALAVIHACQDADVLQSWLMRAYRGETAADIFAGSPPSGAEPC